jgi:two-component system, cell cycle response regulator
VLARLHADERTRPIPVILRTAHATADADVVRGIEGGAVDHLTKPYSGPVLLARVGALARQRRDAFLVAARLAHAERQATTDPLTGLQNRRAFEAQFAREVAFAGRHRAPFALLMLDVDKFKVVNDTWGHAEGDRVLLHVSRLLSDTLRTSDYVFRLGGEEFVALLRGADRSAATHTAERIVMALRSTPIGIAGELRRITASLGVAVADAGTNFDCRGLLERADAALYGAKRAGRDRVEVEPLP